MPSVGFDFRIAALERRVDEQVHHRDVIWMDRSTWQAGSQRLAEGTIGRVVVVRVVVIQGGLRPCVCPP